MRGERLVLPVWRVPRAWLPVAALDVFPLDLGDWPGGRLTVFACRFPDAPDGGMDLVLPAVCAEHARSWYWCPNAGVLWCDGGPPLWLVHSSIAVT